MPTLLAACGIATWMSRSHAYWFSVLPLHGFSSKRGCLQCTIITLTSTASQQFLQGKHHWPAQKKLSKDFFNLQIWTSIHWYNWYSDGAVILQYWNSAYWTRGAIYKRGCLLERGRWIALSMVTFYSYKIRKYYFHEFTLLLISVKSSINSAETIHCFPFSLQVCLRKHFRYI